MATEKGRPHHHLFKCDVYLFVHKCGTDGTVGTGGNSINGDSTKPIRIHRLSSRCFVLDFIFFWPCSSFVLAEICPTDQTRVWLWMRMSNKRCICGLKKSSDRYGWIVCCSDQLGIFLADISRSHNMYKQHLQRGQIEWLLYISYDILNGILENFLSTRDWCWMYQTCRRDPDGNSLVEN